MKEHLLHNTKGWKADFKDSSINYKSLDLTDKVLRPVTQEHGQIISFEPY